jgi:hypothetical protein
MTSMKRIFMVDGKPFFPLGGQCSSSSAYNNSESEAAFKAVKLLHGNTLITDVYWEHIEPEEGKFDFTMVDDLITSALRYGVKLIFLWFATWKNANMDYTPDWVKTNPRRFKRVISPSGTDLWSLSPYCKANFDADKKAFVAFCRYLKAKDTKHTVIGIQVENEPGIFGSDRDYGPEAQQVFDSPVPAKVITWLKKCGKCPVYDIWQKAGGKESGTWPELFGWDAGELMSAWGVGSYIDGVAAAGKAVYNIPMYQNVWLMEVRRLDSRWMTAGETYPSGGAVTKVLDFYKSFTPHLDLIAPDIKFYNTRKFEAVCATYSRDDNPLFFPETPPSLGLFRAVADYNLQGYSRMFFLESIVAEDGSVRPEAKLGVDTVRSLAAAIPLILKYQGTGKIHAVVQEDDIDAQLFDMDGYFGSVVFGEGHTPHVPKDWRHFTPPPDEQTQGATGPNRGRGLVIQTRRNEFYLVGASYRLFLRPKAAPVKRLDATFVTDHWQNKLAHQLKVDEGHYDRNGQFIVDRRRNGDAISGGVWVEADNGVVRVIMCD